MVCPMPTKFTPKEQIPDGDRFVRPSNAYTPKPCGTSLPLSRIFEFGLSTRAKVRNCVSAIQSVSSEITLNWNNILTRLQNFVHDLPDEREHFLCLTAADATNGLL